MNSLKLLLLLLFSQVSYSQETFRTEYYNINSSYEIFSDLNTYKTIIQLSLLDNNKLLFESEVFDNKSISKEKKIIRCSIRHGVWSISNDILLIKIDGLEMKYKISKNGKKLYNLDEDPKYLKYTKLKRVKKKKIITCDASE